MKFHFIVTRMSLFHNTNYGAFRFIIESKFYPWYYKEYCRQNRKTEYFCIFHLTLQ